MARPFAAWRIWGRTLQGRTLASIAHADAFGGPIPDGANWFDGEAPPAVSCCQRRTVRRRRESSSNSGTGLV